MFNSMTDNRAPNAGGSKSRPFLGVMFECCSVYTRIYRNKKGDAYTGNCPKCARRLVIRIAPGGTSSRFFRAH